MIETKTLYNNANHSGTSGWKYNTVPMMPGTEKEVYEKKNHGFVDGYIFLLNGERWKL